MHIGMAHPTGKLLFGVPKPTRPLAPPMGELAAPLGAD